MPSQTFKDFTGIRAEAVLNNVQSPYLESKYNLQYIQYKRVQEGCQILPFQRVTFVTVMWQLQV